MDLAHIKSYEELAAYLRGFVNSGGGGGVYDFGGVANLLGALLDNIDTYALDAEIDGMAAGFTADQANILKRIVSQLDTSESAT